MRAARGLYGYGGAAVDAVFGRGSDCRGLGVNMPGGAHEQKDDERHDEEIGDRVEELAVSENGCAGRSRGGESGVVLSVETDVEFLEIHLAEEETDGRHDYVADHGGDDCAEGCAYDDRHGEIEEIAAMPLLLPMSMEKFIGDVG